MRRILLALLALLLIAPGALKAQEEKVVGSWLPAKKTSHIRVFKATNGKYYGKIDKLLKNPDKLDENNPDPLRQKEPLAGQMILKGFDYDADKKRWTGGTIHDPDNGKTYDCYMWFEEDPNLLYIKGYVLGMKFMGRETIWEKVQE